MTKDPLIAVLFSIFYTGLGQIYAGRRRRGLLIFVGFVAAVIGGIVYVLHPRTQLNVFHLVIFAAFCLFQLWALVDAFFAARAWNAERKLDYKASAGKKTLVILAILFSLFVINPAQLIALPVVLYVRANVVQAFKTPSGAMIPTFYPGDRIFVDKGIYRRSEPKRGDIIVFKYPEDPRKDFIKRLVGLPGEEIEFRDGKILINGIVQGEGTLGEIDYLNQGPFATAGKSIRIPSDSYFVVGDNSISSRDSRYWGFVPKKNLVGKAYKIWWPLDRSGPVA